MKKKETKWQLVSDYPITEYKCGVRAGDRVRLRRDLVVRDHKGKPTRTHPAGEAWTVLSGSSVPPLDVWLKQPDGERHTWSDDDEFWNWFERTEA